MLLAALLDVGQARSSVPPLLRQLGLPPDALQVRRIARQTLSGLQCRVRATAHEHSLQPLIARLRQSRLPAAVRLMAGRMFARLARAERRVHRGTAHAHEVHEIGRIDTLIAIAGCAWLLHELRIRRVFAGPLPLGSGWTRAEEGLLPNPGPAVLELLLGFPVVMTRLRAELVTPTAAAILSTVAQPWPAGQSLVIARVGYGAGTRRIAGVPGLLRACLIHY